MCWGLCLSSQISNDSQLQLGQIIRLYRESSVGVLAEGEWSRNGRWRAQVSCPFMHMYVQLLTLEVLQRKSNSLSLKICSRAHIAQL